MKLSVACSKRELNTILLILSSSIIYSLIFFFIAHTPICADDFGTILTNYTIHDSIHGIYKRYFTWGGALWSQVLVRLVILKFRYAHVVFTPLMIVCLILVIQILYWGVNWKKNLVWWHSIIIFSLLWLFIPSFGQAVFWRTGTLYSWMSFFALLFFIPFRFLLENPFYRPNKFLLIPLFVLSTIAGWSNENLGIVVSLVSICSTIFSWYKTRLIPWWSLICSVLSFAGWLFLILAPGNYVRLQEEAFKEWHEFTLSDKIFNYLQYWIKRQKYFAPLTILICVGEYYTFLTVRMKTSMNITSISLFLCANLTLAAFLFCPPPADRALTCTAIFLCASCYFFIVLYPINKKIYCILTLVLCIIAITSIINNINNFIINDEITKKRVFLLSRGGDVVIPRYKIINKYFFINYKDEVPDLDTNWGSWRYYGVSSISLEPKK